MPSNSGEGKIIRVLAQLENIETLLGGLPKRFKQPDERKNQIKTIINDLSRIQDKLKELYKEELERGDE